MDTWTEYASSAAPTASRRPADGRVLPALDAVLQALCAPAMSFDRLRRVVVRYGAAAHEQALQIEEMLTTLTRAIRDAVDALPNARRAEVLAFVQWWAVHGYHRAD